MTTNRGFVNYIVCVPSGIGTQIANNSFDAVISRYIKKRNL